MPTMLNLASSGILGWVNLPKRGQVPIPRGSSIYQ